MFCNNDTKRRDEVYNEWAAFIDFIIKIYGFEKFFTLLASATPEDSAEYITLSNAILHISLIRDDIHTGILIPPFLYQ